MGVRGEIFSEKVILPNRTYFFNVKENRMGDLYLNIVESKNRDNGGFDRQSVILFADDLQEFLKGFEESLKVMEKAMRGKKYSDDKGVERTAKNRGDSERGGTERKKFPRERSERSNSDSGSRERGGRAERGSKTERGNYRGTERGAERGNRERGGKPERGNRGAKRVVVKKRDRD